MELLESKSFKRFIKKLGNKPDIHVFNTDDPNALWRYYSPTSFPKLVIKRNNVEYQLDVHVLSCEEEDKRLLHHLLVKTRDQN